MDRTHELLLSLASPPPHRCFLCDRESLVGEDGLCDECRRTLKLAISPAPPEGLDGLTAGLRYCDELGSVFLLAAALPAHLQPKLPVVRIRVLPVRHPHLPGAAGPHPSHPPAEVRQEPPQGAQGGLPGRAGVPGPFHRPHRRRGHLRHHPLRMRQGTKKGRRISSVCSLRRLF